MVRGRMGGGKVIMSDALVWDHRRPEWGWEGLLVLLVYYYYYQLVTYTRLLGLYLSTSGLCPVYCTAAGSEGTGLSRVLAGY